MPTSSRGGRHRSPRPPASLPPVGTAPVLAVLVCHNGERWLPEALEALGSVSPRPRYVLAVDTGSTDSTPELLTEALDARLLDGVLTMDPTTGFGAAVRHAVDRAEERWGDPGRWVWLLHDDSAPEPGCLAALLGAAEVSPSVAMLGPLCLDWSDPRLVVEAGLSTDASGHRQTGLAADELDPSLLGGDLVQNTEVLSVGSAGALVRRDVWRRLGGYDPALPLLRDDLDFGWRVNRAGHLVLVVPSARIRHAVASTSPVRTLDALNMTWRAADRAYGLRTFLVNASAGSFLLGVPRLVTLGVLRSLGYALARSPAAAAAEFTAVRYLLLGRAGLVTARRHRRAIRVDAGTGVHGLLTSRWTRLRAGVRGGLLALMRRRMVADAAIGRLPAYSASRVPPPEQAVERPVGPQALPAGAIGRTLGRGGRHRRGLAASVAGLRRPGISVVVPTAVSTAESIPLEARPPGVAAPVRPSPAPREPGVPLPAPRPAPVPELIVVDVGGARLARELLLAPAVLLVAGLVVVAALLHRGRLGLDLTGGRIAPPAGVAETWAAYLAEWHHVLGGTASPASATLAVLGVLGALLRPFGGGPGAAVSLLLLGAVPLAGLSAYFATRRMLVPRWGRALAAASYALLPVGTAATVQGRLDGVVAHVLLPAVLAGVVGVLSGWSAGKNATGDGPGAWAWLPSACATALGLAVISAFAPLVHLLLLALVLVGFVAIPGPRGRGLRRIVALFVIVLLPLGLLLPWPAVVVQHPGVLLHGTGAVVPEGVLDPVRLLVLDAGGPGPSWWCGVMVAVGCVIAVVARPRRASIPGVVVALAGLAAALVVSTLTAVPLPGGAPRPGWPGAAVLLAACGLIWAGLGAVSTTAGRAPAAGRRRSADSWLRSATGTVAAAVVAGLALMIVETGPVGPLTTVRPRLAAPVQNEVATDRTAVLVVGAPDEPVRAAVARLPAFGDDDLAPVATAPTRMARWAAAFRSGQPATAQPAVLEAAVAGFEFVVLPDRATAGALLTGGGPQVTGAPDTTDGRPTVRLLPLPAPAVVLAPQVANSARTGGAPPAEYGREPGTVEAVRAAPPAVGVRTSPGAKDRALVVAAEMEDGWLATVDGQPTQVARAWGHLVAVPLPAEEAEVRLERSSTVRTLLLLVQLAIALFTAITAIPPGDRRSLR